MFPWPAKPLAAIMSFAVVMAAIAYLPPFEQFHALRPATFTAIFEFHKASAPLEAPVQQAYVHLIDRHHALDLFYRALARAEAREPGAVVRVLHFGDSPVSADQITGDLRALLQARFGNAGQGFVLIAKPWAWYNHRGIEQSARGWTIHTASQNPSSDGLHGLGGATFEGSSGATADFRLETAPQRIELQYLAQPGGGSVEFNTGGTKVAEISTAAPARAAGFQKLTLPASTRRIQLRVTVGHVRLFGLSFETDGPGVRYDSLGLNAAQIQTPLKNFNPQHWAEQIRHQRPDLVVINYGTNESGYPDYIDGAYANDVRELVRQVQAATPATSILLMSPMDRATRSAQGQIVTYPSLPKVVETQRQVAAELGCAFFNTFQAMGGEGTMARWYEARPRLASADFMHPLPAGAKLIGSMVDEALNEGYQAFKSRKATDKINAR